MTAEDFRQLALGFEDAMEGAHMGHPDFRANGRIFATLHTGDKTGMVKLLPEEQQEFLRAHRPMFEPSPGAWGRQGCTTVILAEADKSTIRAAMNLAWQHVMDMPPPKTKKRAAPGPKLGPKPPVRKAPTPK